MVRTWSPADKRYVNGEMLLWREATFQILTKQPDCLRNDISLNELIEDIANAIVPRATPPVSEEWLVRAMCHLAPDYPCECADSNQGEDDYPSCRLVYRHARAVLALIPQAGGWQPIEDGLTRAQIDRDELWALFVDHYWDSLAKDRDLILCHISSVLMMTPPTELSSGKPQESKKKEG